MLLLFKSRSYFKIHKGGNPPPNFRRLGVLRRTRAALSSVKLSNLVGGSFAPQCQICPRRPREPTALSAVLSLLPCFYLIGISHFPSLVLIQVAASVEVGWSVLELLGGRSLSLWWLVAGGLLSLVGSWNLYCQSQKSLV